MYESTFERDSFAEQIANIRDIVNFLLHRDCMQVGAHELSLEAPDLVVIRVRGPANSLEVETIAKLLKESECTGTAFILTVLETAHFQGSPEARRHFVETAKGLSMVVNAVVGADFRFRVILRFVENVARVMSKVDMQIDFFDNETSARTWLAARGCKAWSPNAPQDQDPETSTASRDGLSG